MTQVRAVLIGLGMVARMHAAAIAASETGLSLFGVMARDPARARTFADSAGNPKVFSGIGEIAADPKVDFVILATPPDARKALLQTLVAAEIPVLAEKPLERTFRAAEELVEMCEAAKVPFGAVLQHRMRPAALSLARRLSEGVLGDIASVEIRVPWWRDQAYYDAPGRGTYARDGGGVLITQAIHTIDLALQLCGPVTAVQGLIANTPAHTLEAEDFAAATLQFRSGAVGSLTASTTHFPGGSEEIVLNGTRDSAVLSAASLTYHFRDGRIETEGSAGDSGGGADPMAFTHDWHQSVIEDFAEAVAKGRPPAITARSALPAQRLIDAIARSARTGTRIELPEDKHA